jgi:hypothetical protein
MIRIIESPMMTISVIKLTLLAVPSTASASASDS